MKEVEKKDLPGITGGQAGTETVMVITPIPNGPTVPQPGPTDPLDPLGDLKQRHVEA